LLSSILWLEVENSQKLIFGELWRKFLENLRNFSRTQENGEEKLINAH